MAWARVAEEVEMVGGCQLTVNGIGADYAAQQVCMKLMNVSPLNAKATFDPFLFPHPYLLPFKSSQLLLISPLKYVSNLFISHISTSINTRYLSPSLHIPHLDECLSSYMVSLSPLSLLQSLVHPATCRVYFFLELSLL